MDTIISDKIFDALPCGIIPFSAVADQLNNYSSRTRLPKNTKSLIVVLFPYYLGEDAYASANVSRYAVPADYHAVIGARLEKMCRRLKELYPDEEFEAFTDNSPIPEKVAAALAGLGVIGKNSLLINRDYGSYCFIGDIASTVDLNGKAVPTQYCRDCGSCVKACPSGALCSGGFKTELCVSSISQKKGALTDGEKKLLSSVGLIWGCDLCQTSCLMNKDVKTTPINEFLSSAKPVFRRGESLYGRAYAWRGRAVIERNIDIIKDLYNE